jgi:hypothetical protein
MEQIVMPEILSKYHLQNYFEFDSNFNIEVSINFVGSIKDYKNPNVLRSILIIEEVIGRRPSVITKIIRYKTDKKWSFMTKIILSGKERDIFLEYFSLILFPQIMEYKYKLNNLKKENKVRVFLPYKSLLQLELLKIPTFFQWSNGLTFIFKGRKEKVRVPLRYILSVFMLLKTRKMFLEELKRYRKKKNLKSKG